MAVAEIKYWLNWMEKYVQCIYHLYMVLVFHTKVSNRFGQNLARWYFEFQSNGGFACMHSLSLEMFTFYLALKAGKLEILNLHYQSF